jgi:hypothetical protein
LLQAALQGGEAALDRIKAPLDRVEAGLEAVGPSFQASDSFLDCHLGHSLASRYL